MSSGKNKKPITSERSFSPIYSSFEQILEHNKGIFKFFRKSKKPWPPQGHLGKPKC